MSPEPQAEQRVFLGMTAIVASPPTVLITGESGSGKELIARAVHHYSPRSSKPWVDLSCAALPEHLLESELFGYDKGAFSGADAPKPGLFELAHQGTLFLDEVGELDPKMQVKLLRVLDGVPYYRLGGVKKVSADVRVVAATNQDLQRAVKEGRFRNDLYHRLSQFTLEVPPLRERREDIVPLARYVLAQHDPQRSFTARALRALDLMPWSGNVRELRNVVIKASVMATGREIDAADLPHCPVVEAPGAVESRGSLDSMEQRMIYDALAATGGHQQQAASRLGISRRTLNRKLKIYGAEQRSAAAL
jgi:DNA-binding NtrC family response regulator